MRSCLVVGNQTLRGQHLHDFVLGLTEEQPSRFHIVVPATPPSALELDLLHSEHLLLRNGEAPGFALARSALRAVLAGWARSGLTVSGEVGDPAPVVAVRDALADRAYDLIVVSTLPRRRSRWLASRLPARLRAAYAVPVLEVTAPAAPRAAPTPLAPAD